MAAGLEPAISSALPNARVDFDLVCFGAEAGTGTLLDDLSAGLDGGGNDLSRSVADVALLDWFGRKGFDVGFAEDGLVIREPLGYEVQDFLGGSRRHITPHTQSVASVEAKTAANMEPGRKAPSR
jgi:hypothetical protein